MMQTWIVKKKSKRFTHNDEFVIGITGKVKDKRTGSSIIKQLNKQQFLHLKDLIRADADYLSKFICFNEDEPDYDALYINYHLIDKSTSWTKSPFIKVKGWKHEQDVYDLIDDPNVRVIQISK